MIARVLTGALVGIDAQPVMVEVDMTSGLPGLVVVGLPDTIVNEAKERVRLAVKNAGFEFPIRRVVVNLAPADLRKEGAGFDFPIAVGVLLADDMLHPTPFLEKTCFVGEVSLEGSIRPVNGVLSMALMAKEQGFENLVVAEENVAEASLVEGIQVFGLKNLSELPVFLLHPHSFAKPVDRAQLLAEVRTRTTTRPAIDFTDIKGQDQAKRALEIAAAGGHNMLMVGPPGSGKSMLAKAFAGILPPLSFDEILEVSRIYSVAGMLPDDQGLIHQRPFRSPHHSASVAGITGGGSHPKPGEITLSHRGVLFLDEFVEFPRQVLEVLRQPLEDGVVTISRAQQNVTFPARFLLLAALNPCPCGFKGDTTRACTCTETQVQRYLGKLSGPLLDRIDIHLEVPRLKDQELLDTRNARSVDKSADRETSDTVRARVVAARDRQLKRFAETGILCNAEMTPAQIKTHCSLAPDAQEILARAVQRMNLSARAFDRILRLSRTIADLSNSDEIDATHLAEALQYRALDRLYRSSRSVTFSA